MEIPAKRCRIDEDNERNETHISDLPDELLLQIFKYSIENVNTWNVISNVCERFSNVVTHPYLYTTLKIIQEPAYDVFPVVRYYRSAIRVIHLEKLPGPLTNQILTELKGTPQLSTIKIKSITWMSSSINTLREIVEECRELKRFKIVTKPKVLPTADWLPLLNAVSRHPLEEFAFDGMLPREWEVNAFLSSHANTLKSLKMLVSQEMSLTSVSLCSRLTKLNLNFVSINQEIPNSIISLFSLENLTEVSFSFHHINAKQVGKFFSRPCCSKIKTIKLYIFSYRYLYSYIFNSITNNCVNLEKIILRRTIWNYDDKIPFEIVLNLLRKCNSLKHVSLTRIDLLDVLKLDEVINKHNFPALILFETCATVCSRNEMNHYAGIINNNPVKEARCSGSRNVIYNDRNTAIIIEREINKRLKNLKVSHGYYSRSMLYWFHIYYLRNRVKM